MTQYLERHSVSSDQHMKKLMSLRSEDEGFLHQQLENQNSLGELL